VNGYRFLTFAALAAVLFAACESAVDPKTESDEPGGLTSITVTPNTKSIGVNAEFQLTAVKNPPEATDTIEWVSSDPSKVTVTGDGKIKGIAVTETPVTITAKSKENPSISGSCAVTVTNEQVSLTAIAISPATKSIVINEEFQLTVEKTPEEATDVIEWESSDPLKVTVTGEGKIKGIAVTDTGTPVTITVKSKTAATVTGTCHVTVTEHPPSYELKLIHNAGSTATLDDSTATTTVPDPAENRYIINSYFGEAG
jgi:hypothetical protein